MEHDNDVSTTAKRFGVTRLLVAAVPAILRMHDERNPQPLGDFDSVVARRVVDEQKIIDNRHRYLGDRLLEGPSGVVCGKNNHHALSVDHLLLLDEDSLGSDRGEAGFVLIAGVRSLLDLDHLDFFDDLESVSAGGEKNNVTFLEDSALEIRL